MLKLRINSLAAQDLQQIKAYITDELRNPDAAVRVAKNIITACQSLMNMPLMGKKLSTVIDVGTDFRYYISGNYMIFYKADSDYISVYRILYGGRDYMRILFGDFTDITEY